MEQIVGIFQAIGIFIALPALIGFIIVRSFLLWDRRARPKYGVSKLACTINTDCPTGFVCMNGHCVPAEA